MAKDEDKPDDRPAAPDADAAHEARCAACPVPLVLGCPRWPSGHTRVCEWAAMPPGRHARRLRATILAMAAGRRGRKPPPPTPYVPPEVSEVDAGPAVSPAPDVLAVPAPAEFPPLLEQAGTLAGAVGRFVASGLEVASPEVRAERWATCGACEHFVNKRCTLCGCRLAAKIAMKSERCPDDPPRW
jgi:hypothetical protein